MSLLETLGGAAFGSLLDFLFERAAGHEFLRFFREKKIDDMLITKLKLAMLTIGQVLIDLEDRQITSSIVMGAWLGEIKDVVYDVEDILNEIDLLCRLKDKAEEEGSESSSNFDVEAKIREIIERLQLLTMHKDLVDWGGMGKRQLRKLPSTSFLDEPKVFGREEVADSMINFLKSEKADHSIIAIVGMPGIGKSTLAQWAFNHESVRKVFPYRLWVHVTPEFDVLKVYTALYESIRGGDCSITNLDILQRMLHEELKEKKFLVVFDDIWSDSFVHLETLRRIFEDDNHGTMIVTTQLHTVVSTIRATVTHILYPLSELDCWSLFQNYAFSKEIKANPAFIDVGRNISRRCGGIPLIVKAFANLLCNKANMDDWMDVMEGNLWDVMADRSSVNSFILSYQFLSPIAKRCFIYCSVFHNYSMKKETLINLWMVEGCVQQKEGEECFQELVSKSIIQQYTDGSFTMHKVFIELAQNLAGDFAFILKDDNKQQVSNRLRHLSYPVDKTDIVAQLVVSWKKNGSRLRTFLPVKAINSNELDPKFDFLRSLCLTCKHLLVLSMSSYTTFSELPDDISQLKHLCYLDLSHTKVETLPDSVTSLYCLQTLLLFECWKLTELPMDMKNLVNLLYLDVRNTGLRAMPPGFGNLKHLQVLTNFVVGTSGSLISELRELSGLRGKLSISELQNVVDPIDASHASLNNKEHVTELIFQWTASTGASENESYVLEKLQPCENLEKLSIENFRGTSFPNWLGNSKFNRMELMHISGCNFCSNLPPLGQLPYLKTLIFERVEGIKVVGPEFYGNALDSTTSFRSLISLKFIGMLNLEVWQVVDGKEHFPSLEELEVSSCPNIENLPDHLNSVSSLKISGCTKLMILPSSMMSLKYLDISGCAVISAFSFDIFPIVEEAQIRHCEALLSLRVKHHSFLQKLWVEDCPLLYKIKLQAPHLKNLSIFNCKNLELMPKEMNRFLPSLEQLDVTGCSSLKALDKGRLPSSLDEVRISDCDQLIPQADWGLDLTSATSFAIEGGSTGEISFPVEGLLPASLLALHIKRLKNLKCLNHKGLKHLTSLKMIGIHQCENLEDVSKKLPTSLSSLMIAECPLLATHVRERSQEVLDKISHIDLVTIDDLTFEKGKLLQSGKVQQDIGTST